MRLEQLVAVEVKIAHQRRVDCLGIQALADVRYSRSGLVVVDRDPHQFGTCTHQRFDLRYRTFDVGSIGIGHGLHDDGSLTPNGHCTYFHAQGRSTGNHARDYTRGVPFATRTTTVPAILSCHACLASSKAIQKNPRPATANDRKQPSARTIAVSQSISRPSSRTTRRSNTIPPMVEPRSFHMAAP